MVCDGVRVKSADPVSSISLIQAAWSAFPEGQIWLME